jgi:hypothetical protein
MRIGLALGVIAFACGGAPKIKETEEAARDPAWAASYVELAAKACACKDDPCIRRDRATLDAMVAENGGGMDDAPSSVHQAFAKVEVCFKETSLDLARDLGEVAKSTCECKYSFCLVSTYDRLDVLVTKYKAPDRDGLRDGVGSTPESKTAFDRMAKCIVDKTISSKQFLAKLKAVTDELCACMTEDCSKVAIANRAKAFEGYLGVQPDASLRDEISTTELRYCKCYADFLLRGFKVSIAAIDMNLSIHTKCE